MISGLLLMSGLSFSLCSCDRSADRSERTIVAPVRITAGATADISGTFATYGQQSDKLAVVVWSDIVAQRASSGSSYNATEFQGVHRGPDGRTIHWKSRIGSDESSISVNGRDFDLEQGRLLLVTVSGNRPRVKQLDYGIEQFSETDLADSLLGWLKEDELIQQFFTQP